jgi:hypothetical protein
MTTLMSLDEFADSFPTNNGGTTCSSELVVPLYMVLRDLTVKNQLADLKHTDGAAWGISDFVIEGVHKHTGVRRIHLPVSFEAEIDLLW